MALMNDRIRSVGKAELLNLTPLDVNPGISKCEIAVAYEGRNRNGSYISHEEMEDLGRTMRGIPIVGYYSEEKGDFRDHGHRMSFDIDGMHEEVLTVPYGFIAPDADVWFQDVEEETKFGTVSRTYLMCTGYLWTESFPEVKLALEQGRPQSMELSNDRLNGHWAELDEYGMEFFIIEKGSTLSKLCILGSDVPPCFESAEVTAPQISRSFSLVVDDDIMNAFARMTEELKFALSAEGGLNSVEEDIKKAEVEFEETEGEGEATGGDALGGTEENGGEEPGSGGGFGSGLLGSGSTWHGSGSEEGGESGSGENQGESGSGENQGTGENQGSGENQGTGTDDPNQGQSSTDEPGQGGSNTGAPDPVGPSDPGEDEPHVNRDDLDADDEETIRRRRYNFSDEELDAMVSELAELRQFKAAMDDAEKDRVIAKYAMLSDEDKADVISNKGMYTAQEIDEKLALAYVRKNVVFDDSTGEAQEDMVATTFSLDFDSNSEYVPPMVSALRRTRLNNKR